MPRSRAADAAIFWLTGLSGAGKSTLAEAVRLRLQADGYRTIVVDGDIVRRTTSRDLGFSKEDIRLNNARIVELCLDRRKEPDVIFVPVIAPYRSARESAKVRLSPGYYEIYVTAPLDVLAARDVKGLYARAARGEIDNLIGFSEGSPYEPPARPDLILDTSVEGQEESIERLYDFVRSRRPIESGPRTEQGDRRMR